MKIFLCVIIVFFSGLIGLHVKDKFRKEVVFYNEIHMFLQYISIKIAFFQDVYADCIEAFTNSSALKNQRFFNQLLKLVKSGKLTQENFNSIVEIELSKQEQEELFQIFSKIGSTDITGQEKLLAGYSEQIKIKKEEIEKYKKTNADIFAKLSICIGIVICILIY